jgi:hypothetical protein
MTGSHTSDGTVPFVYPHGCTMSVQPPATPLVSSGMASFPATAPVVAYSRELTPAALRTRGVTSAVSEGASQCRGSILVFGSVQMLEDKWLREEMNLPLVRCDRACILPIVNHCVMLHRRADDVARMLVPAQQGCGAVLVQCTAVGKPRIRFLLGTQGALPPCLAAG